MKTTAGGGNSSDIRLPSTARVSISVRRRRGRGRRSAPLLLASARGAATATPASRPPHARDAVSSRRPSNQATAKTKSESHGQHRHQRAEELGGRNLSAADARSIGPRPGQEVHDARGHAARAGQHAPVHAEPLVERQHGRDGDEERHRARAVEVHEQRPAAPSPRRSSGPGADDRAQHAGDDRIEAGRRRSSRRRTGSRRRTSPPPGRCSERPVVIALPGLAAEAAGEGGGDRHRDERHQRR